MFSRYFRTLSLVFAVCLVLTACGSDNGTTATTSPAETTAGVETDPGGTTERQPLLVIATTTILGDLVANVVGSDAEVTVLLPVGADPHDYQASASQVAMLHDADLVVSNGLNLEEGILDVLASAESDGVNLLAVAELLDPLPFGDGEDMAHEDDHDEAHEDEHDDHDEAHEDEHDDHDEAHEDEHDDHGHEDDHDEAHEDEHDDHDEAHEDEHDDHDEAHEDEHDDHDEAHEDEHDEAHEDEHDDHGHDDEHDEAHEDEHDDHGHEDEHDDMAHEDEHDDHGHEDEHHHHHGGLDPHFWLDPLRVAQAAHLIAQELASIDPSIDWAERAEAYEAQITELHEEIQAILEPIPSEDRRLITNHDALGYFAARYGFEVLDTVIPGTSTLADPSTAEMAALVRLIREENVPAIFAETTVRNDLAEALAAEAGTDVEVLELYTGSLGEPGSGADTLIGMLRTNAERIAEGLS